MSNLTRQERAAIEAVARRFSGTWKEMGRYIHSQLRIPTYFEKILMVFPGGRVEELE